jgi:hypothetical protein
MLNSVRSSESVRLISRQYRKMVKGPRRSEEVYRRSRADLLDLKSLSSEFRSSYFLGMYYLGNV